ncbi:MAG: hypothetical protein A2V88_00595 [Elusimicrobia bacterium RBG_16_66_12]|nr:MAG: hypothetical protein A2V88_00595 [Elusimicrobia bacterium RBG_16_66_12]
MRKTLALAALLGLSASAAARPADRIEDGFGKADELISRGKFSQARAELDALLVDLRDKDARMVRYHERKGAAWLGEGLVKEARTAFTSALKAVQRLKVTSDDGGRAYTGMGLCLRREGNDAYALKFFKKALSFDLDEGTRMFAEDQIREIEGSPPQPAR